MNIPEDLKYSKEHEWVRIQGNTVTVGITDYAQDKLGEIVFVELPEEGEEVIKDEPFGAVESVKSVNDVFAPINGKVLELNDPLVDSPELINDDPYGEGWMIRVEISSIDDLKDLLTAQQYTAYLAEELE